MIQQVFVASFMKEITVWNALQNEKISVELIIIKKQNQLGTDLGIFSLYWLPVEWVTTAASNVDHI